MGMPHALLRGGSRFPIDPVMGRRYRSSGWLTHTEYDVLDMHFRLGVENIYFFTKETGPKHRRRSHEGCERLFTELVKSGLITGEKRKFRATEAGTQLFQMTDHYLLHWTEESA